MTKIDLTPRWQDIILHLAVAAANGSEPAKEELLRLAKFADSEFVDSESEGDGIVSKDKIPKAELSQIIEEESTLDTIVQCGIISKYFPDACASMMEAKRAIEDTINQRIKNPTYNDRH